MKAAVGYYIASAVLVGFLVIGHLMTGPSLNNLVAKMQIDCNKFNNNPVCLKEIKLAESGKYGNVEILDVCNKVCRDSGFHTNQIWAEVK